MASQYEAEIALNSAIRANPAPWLGLMRARQQKLDDEARDYAQKQNLLELKLRSDESIAERRRRSEEDIAANRLTSEEIRAELERAAKIEAAKAAAEAHVKTSNDVAENALVNKMTIETGLTQGATESPKAFLARASKVKDQRALGTLKSYHEKEAALQEKIKAGELAEATRRESVRDKYIEAAFGRTLDISPEDKAAIAAVRKKEPTLSALEALDSTSIPKDRKEAIRGTLASITAGAEIKAAEVPKDILARDRDLRSLLAQAERQRASYEAHPDGQRGLALYHEENAGLGSDLGTKTPPPAAGGGKIDRSVTGSAEAFAAERAAAGGGGGGATITPLGPPAPPGVMAARTAAAVPAAAVPTVGETGSAETGSAEDTMDWLDLGQDTETASPAAAAPAAAASAPPTGVATAAEAGATGGATEAETVPVPLDSRFDEPTGGFTGGEKIYNLGVRALETSEQAALRRLKTIRKTHPDAKVITRGGERDPISGKYTPPSYMVVLGKPGPPAVEADAWRPTPPPTPTPPLAPVNPGAALRAINPRSPLNPIAPQGPVSPGALNPYSPLNPRMQRLPITMDGRVAQLFGPDAVDLLNEAGKLSETNGISPDQQQATFNAAMAGDTGAQEQINTVLNYLRQSKRGSFTTPEFPLREYPGPPPGGFGSAPRLYDEPAYAPLQ